jgi:signal peptidase I
VVDEPVASDLYPPEVVGTPAHASAVEATSGSPTEISELLTPEPADNPPADNPPVDISAEPSTPPADPGSRSSPPSRGSHRRTKAAKSDPSSLKTPKKRKPPRPFWVEAVILLSIAAVIAVAVHSFLFQAFFIPSGSMENTLHVGDRVLVNRLSYKVGHVQRGQIVVFSGVDSWTPEGSISRPHNPVLKELQKVGGYLGFAPTGDTDFIKRVIGIPGDHVTCCDAQGRIKVNGKALDENYLSSGAEPDPHATTTQVNAGIPFDITVPPGQLWVEGDHRDNSADSRSHTGNPGGGTIPIKKVVGRAFVVVWPVSHWRGLSIPGSYHALSNTTTAALPTATGLAAVVPLALVRRRRRRRLRSRAT